MWNSVHVYDVLTVRDQGLVLSGSCRASIARLSIVYGLVGWRARLCRIGRARPGPCLVRLTSAYVYAHWAVCAVVNWRDLGGHVWS